MEAFLCLAGVVTKDLMRADFATSRPRPKNGSFNQGREGRMSSGLLEHRHYRLLPGPIGKLTEFRKANGNGEIGALRPRCQSFKCLVCHLTSYWPRGLTVAVKSEYLVTLCR